MGPHKAPPMILELLLQLSKIANKLLSDASIHQYGWLVFGYIQLQVLARKEPSSGYELEVLGLERLGGIGIFEADLIPHA